MTRALTLLFVLLLLSASSWGANITNLFNSQQVWVGMQVTTVASSDSPPVCQGDVAIGTEKVSNGSFESGLSGWNNYGISGGSGWVSSGDMAWDGSLSIRALATSGASKDAVSQLICTTNGVHYRISFWVYCDGASTAALEVWWNGTSIDSISDIGNTGWWAEKAYDVYGVDTNATFLITAAPGSSAMLLIDLVSIVETIPAQFAVHYSGTAAYVPVNYLTITNNQDGANLTLSGYGALSARDVGIQTLSQNSMALGGSAASKYSILPTYSISVLPKAVAIKNVTASNKVYDGTNTATLSGTAALVGSESNGNGNPNDGLWHAADSIGLAGTKAGTFASKNVGTGITVAISGLYLTGTGTNNYTLNPTLTANITAKTLTVTGITASNKTYDGATNATINVTSATLVGNLDGGNVTLNTGSAIGYFTPNGNVGTNKTVQISGLTISGSASGNYSLTQPTTTANITTP